MCRGVDESYLIQSKTIEKNKVLKTGISCTLINPLEEHSLPQLHSKLLSFFRDHVNLERKIKYLLLTSSIWA